MSTGEGPRWRFAITTPGHATLAILDGVATDKKVARILNESWTSTGTVPSGDPWHVSALHTDGEPYLAEGVRFLLGFRFTGTAPRPWKIAYCGELRQVEDVVEDGVAVTHYTAFDSWKGLELRPVTLASLAQPDSAGVIYTATAGNVIVAELLQRTRDAHGTARIDVPPLYGGTAYWAGTFATTAAVDATFGRGMSVAEAWSQLVATGSLDIVLTPVYDPVNRPGILADLNVYAQAGSIKRDAIFAWDRPPGSLVAVSRLEDGTARANKVQLYAAGGAAMPLQTSAASVTKYGEAWSVQDFPGQAAAAAVTAFAVERLLLRKNGRTTISLSPSPSRAPQAIEAYDVGDRVPVYASKALRKAIAGLLRVYAILFSVDDDALEVVDELRVSGDAL